MASRLRGRFSGLPVIIGIAALAIFLLAGLARRRTHGPGSAAARTLSTRAKERLEAKARDLAPAASFYFSSVSREAESLAKLEARDLDESAILEFCRRVVDGSDAFVREFTGEIRDAAAIEGVPPADVQKYLSEKLRELDRVGAPAFRVPPAVSPVRLSILAAPGRVRQSGNGLGPEAAKVQAIQHLLEILAKLPAQSNGARGVENAIQAMRKAIIPFDTTPVAIAFTAPAPNTVTNAIPAISFIIKDSDSGPDPSSRRLLAINAGPVTTGTTDVTAFTQATSDPVNGVVQVSATNIPPTVIQDGFITLQASGTDFANNPRSVATLKLVLDSLPPVVQVNSPANNSSFGSTSVLYNATIRDAVSGVAVSSIQVVLNGVNITGGISQLIGPPNPVGTPNSVQLNGLLNAQIGSNVITTSASDFAGNMQRASITFAVGVVVGVVPTFPRPDIGLEIVSGDGQEGLSGSCTESSLVVHAFDKSNAGQSLDSIPLSVVVTGGGGLVAPDKTRAFITDFQGLASFKYVYGPFPGANTITVGAQGRSDVSSVFFTETTKNPNLQDVSSRGECNLLFGASDYPGSALSRLFVMKATKPDGKPFVGETVEPIVSQPDGKPTPAKVGEFLPSRARTNDDGEAQFAFVIDQNAPVGAFTMRFQLLGFIDENGNPIEVTLPAEVLNPSNKPRNVADTEIDFDDLTRSGQAQIGIRGRRLATPLRARIFGGAGAITFSAPSTYPREERKIFVTLSKRFSLFLGIHSLRRRCLRREAAM